MLPKRKSDLFVYLLLKVLPGICSLPTLIWTEQFLRIGIRISFCFIFCHFNVWIRYKGHVLAKELVEKGVQTTVITDSAVFAMISRVNMVCLQGDYYCSDVLVFIRNILTLPIYLTGHSWSPCNYGKWWSYCTSRNEHGCSCCSKACCSLCCGCWQSQG